MSVTQLQSEHSAVLLLLPHARAASLHACWLTSSGTGRRQVFWQQAATASTTQGALLRIELLCRPRAVVVDDVDDACENNASTAHGAGMLSLLVAYSNETAGSDKHVLHIQTTKLELYYQLLGKGNGGVVVARPLALPAAAEDTNRLEPARRPRLLLLPHLSLCPGALSLVSLQLCLPL